VVGTTAGSFRILKEIGKGGMGAVYLGEHLLIPRKVAIKVLLPELSGNADHVQRFFNEARSAGLINHPGLVDVLDFGYQTSGNAYIVMEYLQGESLRRRLQRGPLAQYQAMVVARQVATAVGAAHNVGIVHRDLKPDNLVLLPDPEAPGKLRVKVLDFGLAKLMHESFSGVKTEVGNVLGTPYYMAPEQCRHAGQVDARADIYSLGCILFEMVCGAPPFPHKSLGEVLGAQLFTAPPKPSSMTPQIAPDLEQLILRMLAKEPDTRPQRMEQVKAELDAVLEWDGDSLEIDVAQFDLHVAAQDTVPGMAPPPGAARRGLPLVALAGLTAAVLAGLGVVSYRRIAVKPSPSPVPQLGVVSPAPAAPMPPTTPTPARLAPPAAQEPSPRAEVAHVAGGAFVPLRRASATPKRSHAKATRAVQGHTATRPDFNPFEAPKPR
jgi:hypothetical protein